MKVLERISRWLKKREEIRDKKTIKMIEEEGLCPNHSPDGVCSECVNNSNHPDGCQCYFCRPYR